MLFQVADSIDHFSEPTEIMLVGGKTTQWLDYLPSPALLLVATSAYCAVAMQDGSVNIYSPTGRRYLSIFFFALLLLISLDSERLMPTLCLGPPAAFMEGTKNALMVITAAGQLYSWYEVIYLKNIAWTIKNQQLINRDVKKRLSNFPPISVAPIFSTTPNCTIESVALRPNGVPMIHTSDHVIHSYDPPLQAWVKLTELWWSEGSDVWQPRQRSNANSARGIVSSIECTLSSSASLDPSAAEKPRPQWWNTALTLGHLETKLLSAKLLDSPTEYKQALLVYAKKIADEAFRGKAEELIKDLFGPVYWYLIPVATSPITQIR
jgi:protein HIRA/HIR1